MPAKHTLRFETSVMRLEIYVEIKRCEPHDGQLDTDLQPINGSYNELSISMGSWERKPRGRVWREDCFGQGIDAVESFAATCTTDVRQSLERLCEIWRAWHLGGLSAGTTAQAERIAAGRATGEITNCPDFYGQACAYLEAGGLLNDRGHKYGAQWLVKRLPTAVCAEVLAICERLATD